MANIATRIFRKLQTGGIPAVAASAQGRYRRWAEERKAISPVRWARFGSASYLLSRGLKPLQPPLVVLAFPRSGSSWVGETLGQAANAMYLAEPINQSILTHGIEHDFLAEPLRPPAAVRRFADLTFAACPAFRRFVVKFPDQWALRGRRRRRLVVKEVLPAACEWLVKTYRPRVVLLVRHPAAVALSFQRVGWWISQPGDWNYHGTFQGRMMRAALEALNGCRDYRMIRYEDLCADPLGRFREMATFAGLQWNAHIERLIQTQASGGDRGDLWGTSRDTRSLMDDWRGGVTTGELTELRTAYAAFDLPWYRSAQDW